LLTTYTSVTVVQSSTHRSVGHEAVPGFSAWMGQLAVLQIIQYGPDGLLYPGKRMEMCLSCAANSNPGIAPVVPPLPDGGDLHGFHILFSTPSGVTMRGAGPCTGNCLVVLVIGLLAAGLALYCGTWDK
jgi:hypothetical protein